MSRENLLGISCVPELYFSAIHITFHRILRVLFVQMDPSMILRRGRFSPTLCTCREPLGRRCNLRNVASSGQGDFKTQPENVQMPNGVYWLDKEAHRHDIVYGQV